MAADVLDRFSPATREWFRTTFRDPTAAQAKGWPAIADGDHALILAPTGSGKTLTAFLHAIDRLSTAPEPDRDKRLRVLYVSPLKALAVDIDKNLRAPLRGVQLAAERLGLEWREPTVGVRTGDTEPSERQRMLRTPPDILITTPESLFLLLTSRARETLRSVDTVIIDEIHALAPSKRGSHLALSLERLEHEVTTAGSPAPQRIALSATQRPLDEIARFLGGAHEADQPARSPGDRQALADHRLEPRPVTIVDAGVRKQLELDVVVPVEDMGDLGAVVEPASELAGPTRRSIWPAMHPRLLDLVLDHGSTLIFVNARRLAERLAATLNQLHERRVRDQRLVELGIDPADADDSDEPNVIAALAEPVVELVRAHHGSLSRERRLSIEDDLKAGRLRGLVATSSLELGIDMGAVDLVIQVSSPGSVSRGLQRIGRAGHHVGQPSKGTLFPRFRGDLLETAVVVQRMEAGDIEPTRYPRNP
ncbi:MAG TPA: DEAD/DEAH box helicase, partial [Nitriliruptorales bacterium]